MPKHPRTVVSSKLENSTLARKFRTFLRWMQDNGIAYSDELAFELGGSGSVADIGVKALVEMKEGDLIAGIPKQACLTPLTTAASAELEEAEFGGGLALTVALMFEKSLQGRSRWYGYLQLLPDFQRLPYLWTSDEIEELLCGTELHQAIDEDKELMEEDWKESIAPLTELYPEKFPADWFGLDQYVAAKTLVHSRAFDVDEYHGYGMVPFADLFNHKTAAEDVHFTTVDSDSEDDSEEHEVENSSPTAAGTRIEGKRISLMESNGDQEEKFRKDSVKPKRNGSASGHLNGAGKSPQETSVDSEVEGKRKLETHPSDKQKGKHLKEVEVGIQGSSNLHGNNVQEQTDHMKQGSNRRRNREKREVENPQTQLLNGLEESDSESTEAWEGQSEILEMILVKNVAAGSEIFNTYGNLSNAALLHRYGFTELNNPFDIVNVDLSLVVDAFERTHSPRQVRRRVKQWKAVFCSPDSQQSDYFEISATGKPEEGLLMLLYILNISDERFDGFLNMPDSPHSENTIEATASFLGWRGNPEGGTAAMSGRRKTKGGDRKVGNEEKLKVDLETWLLTAPVGRSMLAVLELRNSLYPTDSLEADEALLSATDSRTQPERFHALRLRISERSILRKCQTRVSGRLVKVK
ncbi:hypothetical protein R1sor_023442 [Riccia sorocarpa]|uniref:Rubisco LSMT substrate-binding domain-containing protein n=1 Tax=Riccia sorocarpa TaxID=122646 RepID=A0ABD3GRN6_9MARC